MLAAGWMTRALLATDCSALFWPLAFLPLLVTHTMLHDDSYHAGTRQARDVLRGAHVARIGVFQALRNVTW